MKKIFIIVISLMILKPAIAQEVNAKKHLLILNFINPGIEYEYSISDKSKISANIGYGVSMSYPNLTDVQPKHAFFASPFFDLQYKVIYNLNRRKAKNKSTAYNAGDFFGIKLTGRGKNVGDELKRTDNLDFAVGPTWGIRRNFKKISLNFNVGPQFYFDRKGNIGFYPVMLGLNVGYILTNK